jgi:hypothetical protein
MIEISNRFIVEKQMVEMFYGRIGFSVEINKIIKFSITLSYIFIDVTLMYLGLS